MEVRDGGSEETRLATLDIALTAQIGAVELGALLSALGSLYRIHAVAYLLQSRSARLWVGSTDATLGSVNSDLYPPLQIELLTIGTPNKVRIRGWIKPLRALHAALLIGAAISQVIGQPLIRIDLGNEPEKKPYEHWGDFGTPPTELPPDPEQCWRRWQETVGAELEYRQLYASATITQTEYARYLTELGAAKASLLQGCKILRSE